jgi:transketolase
VATDLPYDLARVFTHGGHPGGTASTLRILRAFRPAFRPTDLVLSSKGHDAAAFLIDQVERGVLEPFHLDSYRQVNGYPGHPERGVSPWAEVSTGSLGMGLSKAVGLAYARPDRRVVCIVGDGETQEGQVWEALQNAARLGLSNLVVLLDHNGGQSDNLPLPQPNVLWPEGLFKAAGWAVYIWDTGTAPGWPNMPGMPLCVLVHGEKRLPHALSTRPPLVEAYRTAILLALEADPRLVLLEADLAYDHGLEGLDDLMPGRHVLHCGISEQHMVSMAVGLAAAGWHPVCHTFDRFFYRAAEQVLDALQEPGLVIRFVGGLAGLLPQGPGRSHELPPELARTLFPIQTYTPLSPEVVGPSVQSMLRQPRSTYLRLLAQPELGG